MPIRSYLKTFMFLLIALPLLGSFMTGLYILQENIKINILLAFQIGLTSPAIVVGILSSSANYFKNKPISISSTEQ